MSNDVRSRDYPSSPWDTCRLLRFLRITEQSARNVAKFIKLSGHET